MKRIRLLSAIGVLLLVFSSVLPLWRIVLEAPQYPEPIGMYIYVHTIRGIGEHDLENINILNHYIGMKAIEPDSIPELRLMPWVLAGLVILGIAAVVLPRRWTVGIWLGAMVISSAVGLYDFNQWEIDYGTNLDPNAPIKIEGMTYKPPLIGTEQLLNITAHSYPSLGGYAILLAIMVGVIALFGTGQQSKQPDLKGRVLKRKVPSAISLGIILLSISSWTCSPSPEPIHYGRDECAVCRMLISDQRFGTEIVLGTGKVYKFDSIECLVHFLRHRSTNSSDVVATLVTNFVAPGTLVDAHTAYYLRSEKLPSPMGADLSAYATEDQARHAQAQYGGDVLSWEAVQQYVMSLD